MLRSEYDSTKAVNYSTLKHLRQPGGSPARYRYFLDNPVPETPAMLLGRAVHTAVLEPERFTIEYVVWNGNRRGKKFDEFAEYEEGQGRTILTESEYDTCSFISDSVRTHDEAAAILSEGEAEFTLRWTNPETGIECKGRADWIRPGTIADLKTTHDISARNFARHSWQMGTFFQMAMYQEGFEQMGNGIASVAIIAAEQKPPYLCCVYHVDDQSLVAAWNEYITCLGLLKQCRADNNWPGPESGTLTAPGWIMAEVEEPLMFGGEEMDL